MHMLGALENHMFCSIRLSHKREPNPYEFLLLQTCSFPTCWGQEIICFVVFSVLINPRPTPTISWNLGLQKCSFPRVFQNAYVPHFEKILCLIIFSFLRNPRPTPKISWNVVLQNFSFPRVLQMARVGDFQKPLRFSWNLALLTDPFSKNFPKSKCGGLWKSPWFCSFQHSGKPKANPLQISWNQALKTHSFS